MKTMLSVAQRLCAAQYLFRSFLLVTLLSCLARTVAAITVPAISVSPSNVKITGDGYVPCAHQPSREYTGAWSGTVLASGALAGAEWHWSVEGGSFPGGGTELAQPGSAEPTVRVDWHRFSRQGGNLRLELVHGGETLGAASLHVVLGMVQPKGIAVEGGVLSCEGNWFTLETDVPLNGDETVEWSVANGLGMDGQPLFNTVRQGNDAHRLFVEKADHDLPLKVSAKVKANCGKSSRASKPLSAEFDYPRTRLTGREIVERGSTNSFAVCHLPSKGNGGDNAPVWGASGTIVQQGASSATVQFNELGEHTVSMTFEDCKGLPETRTWRVRVVDPGAKGPVPFMATTAPKREFACKVYPNPASDGSVFVELDEGLDGHLEIMNLQGMSMLSRAIGGGRSTVETRGYVPGTYLVRVTTAKGERTTKLQIRQY